MLNDLQSSFNYYSFCVIVFGLGAWETIEQSLHTSPYSHPST